MNKSTIFVGIDISKDVFDVYDLDQGHSQFSNDEKGFILFIKQLTPSHWCVMEATGCYHQGLAIALFDKNLRISVINPLIIKRFIQMKLTKIKTDKSDSKMICLYGEEQALDLWSPEPDYIVQCKRLQGVVRLYFKQRTALKNTLHSITISNRSKGKLERSIIRQLKNLDKEIGLLESEIEKLIRANEQALFTRLKTIPGVGKKTSMLLIVSTNGFRDFESSGQLSSYFGIAPNERSSGSSIRGKSRISKRGDSLVRNHLFLCSFTACVHNPQCKALYDRIVRKGKSKKLALIAVCNKLLKQAYGIAKSGLDYDREYVGGSN